MCKYAVDGVFRGSVDLGPVVVDADSLLKRKEATIAKYTDCLCQYGPKKTPYHKRFTAAEYREMHDESHELSRDELDLVIMGQHRTLSLSSATTQRAKQKDSP